MEITYDYSTRYEVFGSNDAGLHGKGHALFCRKYFDAKLGVGEGLTGQSYALPTKDAQLNVKSLYDIENSFDLFLDVAADNPDKHFFMGKIGTGLAGYKDSDILPILKDRQIPSNVFLPGVWDAKLNDQKELRLIIAGGRDFSDFDLLCEVADSSLERAISLGYKPIIISGTAKGADMMGEKYARMRQYDVVRFPAPWNEFKAKFGHNKVAGFVRNSWMSQYANSLLAFHDGESRGTQAMIDIATDFGLKTKIQSY